MTGIALATLSLACGDVANAQPAAKPTPTTSADATEARLRFDEGIKLAEVGDHEAARLKFNQAWALLKSPGILFNLARAEHLSSRFVDAYEHYRQFVKWPADPKITETQRQRAGESLLEISKKLVLVDVVAPNNAKVTVDGRIVETADPVVLLPGKYKFESTIEGASLRVAVVEGKAGSSQKVDLTDEALSRTSTVPLPSNSAGNNANNGAGTGEPPKETSTGGFWSGGRIVGASVFGLGLAGVGVGLVFHFGAAKSEQDATDARNALPDPKDSACTDPKNAPTCSKLTSSVSSQHSKEGLRTGFLVGGGVLALVGVVVFIVAGPKTGSAGEPARGGLRVIPILSDREQGMALTGRF